MARNTAHLHTDESRAIVDSNRVLFGTLLGQTVSFSFVKRDGTLSTLSGVVDSLGGSEGTEIVTLDTDKGPRSANLWTISAIDSI